MSTSTILDESINEAAKLSIIENRESALFCRGDLNPVQRDHLENVAFQNSSVPESYDIATADDGLLQTPCGRGFVRVLDDRKFWHIPGGLIAEETLKTKMISWLREVSEEKKKTIAVYNMSEDEARLFKAEGFIVNKFGDEAVLDLKDHSWSGKRYEWVRRQANFCNKANLKVVEVRCGKSQQNLSTTLIDIANEDFSYRTFDKPLRLLEGEFNPKSLLRRRLFVTYGTDGLSIEAFLSCTPIHGGKGWAFETYRKRKESTRGVVPFLFKTVIDQLQEEGSEFVSLCLIPGRKVAENTFSRGNYVIEKSLEMWFHRLGFLFNVKGQDHFKSRFRPKYVSRYMCVAPRNSVRSFWSFLKTTGATNMNYKNLSAQIFKGFK